MTRHLFFAITVFFLVVLFVFFWNSFYNKGLLAYLRLSKELEEVNNQFLQVYYERIELEQKVNLIRAGSVDKDYLEELSKKTLGVSYPSEKIVVISKHK